MESQSLALKLEFNREFFPIKTFKKPSFQPKLPKSSELPDSDDKPVDNELQALVPDVLREILSQYWNDRTDWFFGVNMGIYHTTGKNPKIPIVPDGFLSLGVHRQKGIHGRKSYVLWEENEMVPKFVLEVVSQTYGGEYDDKMTDYARLGVKYYVIYNPQYYRRDKHERLEVYHLVDGKYVLKPDEPFFMEEIGLGIGCAVGVYQEWKREWLYWYDKNGKRLKPPTEKFPQLQRQKERALEKAKAERQRAQQAEQQAKAVQQRAQQAEQRAEQAEQQVQIERQRAELLAKRLREMGIDPNSLI